MHICDAKGRDCIEKNSAETFNCSTACTGIYADVQWVGSDIQEEIKDDLEKLGDLEENVGDDLQRKVAFLEREMMLMKQGLGEKVKSTIGKGIEDQDKKEYKMLITEYRKFKSKNVKHFRFNSAANMSAFCESYFVQMSNGLKINFQ